MDGHSLLALIIVIAMRIHVHTTGPSTCTHKPYFPKYKCSLQHTLHVHDCCPLQMAFQGTLYVTDRHTAFSVEERGRKLPFKVAHGQVVRATRQRPARKGERWARALGVVQVVLRVRRGVRRGRREFAREKRA